MPNAHPMPPLLQALPALGLARVKRLLCLACVLTFSLAWAYDAPPLAGKTYVLNARALPLGDGRVSARAQRGYVYACQSTFRGGGAQHVGDWVNGLT